MGTLGRVHKARNAEAGVEALCQPSNNNNNITHNSRKKGEHQTPRTAGVVGVLQHMHLAAGVPGAVPAGWGTLGRVRKARKAEGVVEALCQPSNSNKQTQQKEEEQDPEQQVPWGFFGTRTWLLACLVWCRQRGCLSQCA